MSPKARERIATLLVEAVALGDKAAAERHGISIRSLQRYRLKLAGDPELARLVAAKKIAVESDWAADLPHAMRASIGFLKEAAECADKTSTRAIAVISEALVRMSDVAATWKLLDTKMGADKAKPIAAVVPLKKQA